MMPARTPRHEKIIELIRENNFMPIDELARVLDVTPQTIRRDINQLCEAGLLRRYHGGAALDGSMESEDYFSRQNKRQSGKAHIADILAAQIPDNASLFMSIGITLEAVALALTRHHKNLSIITNNIHIASIMSSRSDFNVMITSGVVRAVDGGITGVATIDFINQFKVDYAVLNAASMEADGSLLDFDYKEVSVMQTMMQNARFRYLAVDQSKVGRNALVRMGNVTEFHALFTDEELSSAMAKKLSDSGVRWYLADKED